MFPLWGAWPPLQALYEQRTAEEAADARWFKSAVRAVGSKIQYRAVGMSTCHGDHPRLTLLLGEAALHPWSKTFQNHYLSWLEADFEPHVLEC